MTDKFLQQLNNHSSNVRTDAASEELRCQYSSKRCLNERTHKKSGGLHKFCAMHREKANRNQMRLDHRRRVLKQQQKEQQRHQQAQQQMLWFPSHSPVDTVTGQNFCCDNRMQHSPTNAWHSPGSSKPTSPTNMSVSVCMPMQIRQTMQSQQQQPISDLPMFDQHDLDILEAMLFSSDEEQNEATPIVHCTTPELFHSPSIVDG